MAHRFDAIVLGMGPGGEVAASGLIAGGKKVAVVETELIGSEYAYWACIPSKTLLRPPEARSEARRAAGTGTPALTLEEGVCRPPGVRAGSRGNGRNALLAGPRRRSLEHAMCLGTRRQIFYAKRTL